MDDRIKTVPAQRIKDGASERIEDTLVAESPLTIFFNDQELVTLLCTFEHVDELAAGFLRSEGFLKSAADIESVKVNQDEAAVYVTSRKKALIAEQTFMKRYITTGCGKGTSFYHLADAVINPVETTLRVKAEQVMQLMIQAQRMSDLFKTTGGVHSSAICNTEEILFFREDIGRHNSVDKLIGRCFFDGVPMDDKILLTTGRISSEILIKSAKLGVPVLVSRSAPTDLAVQHAGELGVTIAGFVRNQRMNVYTSPERIIP